MRQPCPACGQSRTIRPKRCLFQGRRLGGDHPGIAGAGRDERQTKITRWSRSASGGIGRGDRRKALVPVAVRRPRKTTPGFVLQKKNALIRNPACKQPYKKPIANAACEVERFLRGMGMFPRKMRILTGRIAAAGGVDAIDAAHGPALNFLMALGGHDNPDN
jgi:hypothetical protein